MALDQAIAELYPQVHKSTIRFYSWSPACVSIGLGQRLERDVDVQACAEQGVDVVRRPTGGRAILHDQEVTYAVVTALDHPLIKRSNVVESYRAISSALCAGLRQLGLDPELAPQPEPSRTKSAACFDLPGDYEITVGGRKLVGSAQARQREVLLQHGTLLLHADVALLARLLRLPAALTSDQLAQRLVALDEVLGYQPTFEAVVEALVQGFEQTWGITLVAEGITPAEQERAADLIHDKYTHADWTRRR